MHVKETDLEGVDWIYLAQDRGRWRALIDTTRNHKKKSGTGLTAINFLIWI